jgi:sec-independent protein translocase protein TatB
VFGVDTSELIIVAIAALVFIGPKELPQTLRTVGRWVGQIRGMAGHFRAGVEAMIREAELDEMEKKWREENERIMREYPAVLEGQAAEAAEPRLPLDDIPDPLSPPPGAVSEGEFGPPEKRELP